MEKQSKFTKIVNGLFYWGALTVLAVLAFFGIMGFLATVDPIVAYGAAIILIALLIKEVY